MTAEQLYNCDYNVSLKQEHIPRKYFWHSRAVSKLPSARCARPRLQ